MALIKPNCTTLAISAQAWRETLEKLNQTIEWTLFWYGRQEEDILPNRTDICGPLIKKVFGDAVHVVQRQHEEENKTCKSWQTEIQTRRSRDILVVFCRESKVTQNTYKTFYTYCKHYGITDAVIVSAEIGRAFSIGAILGIASTQESKESHEIQGLSQEHQKPQKTQESQEPHIRLLAYEGKGGLFYNIIRTHSDIPLFRLLNPLELAVWERRYGPSQNFQKLKQIQPACQYYGFRVGDVVLSVPGIKKIGKGQKYSRVLDQIDQIDTWIDHLSALIVV